MDGVCIKRGQFTIYAVEQQSKGNLSLQVPAVVRTDNLYANTHTRATGRNELRKEALFSPFFSLAFQAKKRDHSDQTGGKDINATNNLARKKKKRISPKLEPVTF